MQPADFRERDPFSPIAYVYPQARLLHAETSPWQEILVLEHPYFGRVLALDGVVQLTERDEHFYHEMLAQVALHAHPRPRELLIVGGGDGGCLREALKHRAVRRATVVEIDERVIAVAREFFPHLAASFGDPRVSLVYGDGAEFVQGQEGAFDLILVDSTDPVGPAEGLFSREFFAAAFGALREDGIFVAQTESLHFHLEFVVDVQRKLRERFPIVELYAQPLATYAGNWWGFAIASKRYDPRLPRRRATVPTRYYSSAVHRWAFVPRSLQESLTSRGSFR